MTVQEWLTRTACDKLATTDVPRGAFKKGREIGFEKIPLAQFSKERRSALYRGAQHAGCDLSAYVTAILMIESSARRKGEFMAAFNSMTAKERAVVSRYRKWLDRLHRQLNGQPLDMEQPRRVAHQVGVPLNTLIAEGLRRVTAEFNSLGGVRFGNGRARA